jgi:hypothetical protein
MSFVPFNSIIRADEGYGVVTTEKGEMYKDTQGNLFPVVVVNGEKLVKLNEYELAPLEALLKRDAKESKGESALPKEILKQFYASTYPYVTLPSIVSYTQRYKIWEYNFRFRSINDWKCWLFSYVLCYDACNIQPHNKWFYSNPFKFKHMDEK